MSWKQLGKCFAWKTYHDLVHSLLVCWQSLKELLSVAIDGFEWRPALSTRRLFIAFIILVKTERVSFPTHNLLPLFFPSRHFRVGGCRWRQSRQLSLHFHYTCGPEVPSRLLMMNTARWCDSQSDLHVSNPSVELSAMAPLKKRWDIVRTWELVPSRTCRIVT